MGSARRRCCASWRGRSSLRRGGWHRRACCASAKALIAGYTGWSCEEYLDWGLRKAEAELSTRPERLHVLLIIHDGEPVFRTRTTSDWDLSLAHLRSLERAGFIPIGVHLGNENGETKSVSLDKLHKLFPRLVNCPNGEALPDKLAVC